MGFWTDFMAWLKPPAIKPIVITPQIPILPIISISSDIPQCGIDLIKSFEKCELVGYADQGGIPTDGWGNTHGAQIGVAITQDKADADLVNNLRWAAAAVKSEAKVPLTQNQFGALLSFAYNLGETRFDKEAISLLFMLNSGNYEGVPNKLKQFVWVRMPDETRKISDGLVRRRRAEALLWTGSDWRRS